MTCGACGGDGFRAPLFPGQSSWGNTGSFGACRVVFNRFAPLHLLFQRITVTSYYQTTCRKSGNPLVFAAALNEFAIDPRGHGNENEKHGYPPGAVTEMNTRKTAQPEGCGHH